MMGLSISYKGSTKRLVKALKANLNSQGHWKFSMQKNPQNKKTLCKI